MVSKELLKVRAAAKLRKPTYIRAQSHQFKTLANKPVWRAPRGMGNKNRRNRKGHIGTLKVGYGSPKAVKGLNKDGLNEVLVANVSELSKVKTGDITIISSTVGAKKRIEILKAIKSAKLKVNVKDIDKAIENLIPKKKISKKAASKIAKEKVADKKVTTDKKSEESKK